eukprot:2795832-Pleurochrysis_carterae.AAC.1
MGFLLIHAKKPIGKTAASRHDEQRLVVSISCTGCVTPPAASVQSAEEANCWPLQGWQLPVSIAACLLCATVAA